MRLFSTLLLYLSAILLMACSAQEQDSGVTEGIKPITKPATSPPYETLITAGKLSGLHTDAGLNTPIVLMIPGSGSTDLNGNNHRGLAANSYKLLADALAENAISSVRIDKRGMYSSAEAGDPNQVTVEIYAQDYSDWVDVIRAKTNADCVYVLGHSEGALMASAASVINQDVCGQILVSGVGRPFGDLMREQLRKNPFNKPILGDALNAIDQLERGETVDISKFHHALKSLFAPQIQDYQISLFKRNPADTAREANVRTLVLHGTTDIQTSVEDAKALASATKGKLVLIEGVNHVLKYAPLNRFSNLKTYGDPNLPIAVEVVDAIANFINQTP